eukprot:TRINITY_DN9411_c1_g1_i1.p1 TRINITY_DN9411_c1_g1~~TRINITY_DN9411_c1_g1_i1.p1  ORF type:complete len:291 (-),score=55.20 TRINITY_DN9411_c1_g1_i1:443-1315(-)
MALPHDFWRSEQMLNIFRSKKCQRLCRAGFCEWRSFCQYSHTPGWPRRSPREHTYSAEPCPHLSSNTRCPQGARCPYAHSKDEVFYHPTIFKTRLCEDFREHRAARRGRRAGKCHRHYCPFAHGFQELRESPLADDVRETCIMVAMEMFPSDFCCKVCPPVHVVPDSLAAVCALNGAAFAAGAEETRRQAQAAWWMPPQAELDVSGCYTTSLLDGVAAAAEGLEAAAAADVELSSDPWGCPALLYKLEAWPKMVKEERIVDDMGEDSIAGVSEWEHLLSRSLMKELLLGE